MDGPSSMELLETGECGTMAPGKGIDYSKWDNIEDSDEEDAGAAKPPPRAAQVRRRGARRAARGARPAEHTAAVLAAGARARVMRARARA